MRREDTRAWIVGRLLSFFPALKPWKIFQVKGFETAKTGPIRLGIVSDGTRIGTKVIDLDTGREVRYVTSVDYRVSASDRSTYAILTVAEVPAVISAQGYAETDDPFGWAE